MATGTVTAPAYIVTGNDNRLASSTSVGMVDVTARIKPDVVAPGVNVLSSVTASFCAAPPCFAFFAGTSRASPHFAGADAVVIASIGLCVRTGAQGPEDLLIRQLRSYVRRQGSRRQPGAPAPRTPGPSCDPRSTAVPPPAGGRNLTGAASPPTAAARSRRSATAWRLFGCDGHPAPTLEIL